MNYSRYMSGEAMRAHEEEDARVARLTPEERLAERRALLLERLRSAERDLLGAHGWTQIGGIDSDEWTSPINRPGRGAGFRYRQAHAINALKTTLGGSR